MQGLRFVMALILCALLLASCASTPMSHTAVLGTWKADNYNRQLSNILVISLADEPGIREKFESIMVARLRKEGLHAIASSDIMAADEEINRRTVKSAMEGKGIDGVLVSRLLGVERDAIYVPPSSDSSLETTFNRTAPIVTSPGYVEHRSIVNMQIDLYDTASEHLVWSLRSQTVNPSNVTEVMDRLSNDVTKDLRGKGLI
jgi:predicted GNAT family acetyltransferase